VEDLSAGIRPGTCSTSRLGGGSAQCGTQAQPEPKGLPGPQAPDPRLQAKQFLKPSGLESEVFAILRKTSSLRDYLLKAKGSWRDDERDDVRIRGKPVVVHCYTTPADIQDDRNLAELGSFCRKMGREARQGEIALVVGDEYFAIRNFGEE